MPMTFKPGFKIGILGGGQLARMLVLAAHRMGIEPHVFSEFSNDPAAQVTAYHHQGRMDNPSALAKFVSAMDLVTFESEFLDADILSRINKKQKKIFPKPELMGQLQDRKSQKELFDHYGLPTAAWINIESQKDLLHVLHNFEFPLVLKKRRFGYDGYGTYVVKTEAIAHKLLQQFKAQPPQEPFIAEQLIQFERELACIFSRNRHGDISVYPLVESLQKEARCFWVKGPIQHKKFPLLTKKISRFLEKINYVGVMGIEFFESGKDLLINEIAPRVHNSGHYTMDAFEIDQFELHLRSILGASIEIPKCSHSGFAMLNLLGETENLPSWKIPNDAFIHWYGKKQNRPGRKMGHINSVGSSPKKALKKALKAREKVSL